jgi:hypothetical protein
MVKRLIGNESFPIRNRAKTYKKFVFSTIQTSWFPPLCNGDIGERPWISYFINANFLYRYFPGLAGNG